MRWTCCLSAPPLPQTAFLTTCGVYGEARDAGHARREQHHAACLADREGALGVAPEVEVLDRDRGGLVLPDQVADARVDVRQPALERHASARLDHAAVERRQRAPAHEHHAIARMRGAGIDAEHNHLWVGFCVGPRTPSGAQRVPRQVISANRNCTGRRAHRSGAGMRAKSFELTAMWMFAG